MKDLPGLTKYRAVIYVKKEWLGFWEIVGKIGKQGFKFIASEKKEERFRLFATVKKLQRRLSNPVDSN
jgi:hypothetical protein